jgi:hypothetical protein
MSLRRKSCLPILLCFATVASIASAQDKTTPETLVRSKYVYIGIMRADGGVDDNFSTSSPDDRRVRDSVEDAFRKWKRYNVTLNRNHADIVVLVRKGRLGSLTLGGSPIDTGSTTGSSGRRSSDDTRNKPGVTLAADGGPNVDVLEVRSGPAAGGTDMLLWRQTGKDALTGAPPRLFERLKDEVEKSAKKLGI